jgi:hypothetical protein
MIPITKWLASRYTDRYLVTYMKMKGDRARRILPFYWLILLLTWLNFA